MSDPVNEVKGICEKLSPEYQHILLRYAQVAYTAENAVRKSSSPASHADTGHKQKAADTELSLLSEELLSLRDI